MGRAPPDAGHLPGSHASSLRSFPSSCHVLERSNGLRDYATCRPENRAGAAVFPCCVSDGFEVSVSAGLGRWLYVPTVLNSFSYIRKNLVVSRTNSRVKAEIVRRINPNVRTCKSDFNITGFFGLVSVDSSPRHCRCPVTIYWTYFQFITYLDLTSVIGK